MNKKKVLLVFLSLVTLLSILGSQFGMFVAGGSEVSENRSSIIRVPQNYTTIQEAIDAASSGDTILVAADIYYEHLNVSKTLSLIGENPLTTIIDGSGIGNVVLITASNVEIKGFTIQNGSYSGILTWNCTESTVSNNIITKNYYGLELRQSNSSNIIDNIMTKNSYAGIRISGDNNKIHGNMIANNSVGVWIAKSTIPNTFFHNNFLNNTNQAGVYASTRWDNGAEGNYWSDYAGEDSDGDGIGDTGLLPHLGLDYYPLIDPWSLIRVFDVYQKGKHHYVTTCCNSTVASFTFSQPKKRISFNVTSGASGFCNVTIPKQLLNCTDLADWEVRLDGVPIAPPNFPTPTDNETHTFVYFTYTHSTHKVQVVGTEAISNMPPTADFTYSLLNHNLINFTHASIDPDGAIIRWYWDFGDDKNSTEQNPIHTFAENRTYTVTLTVTDNVQASNAISKTVIVGKIKLTLNVPSTATVGETIIATATLKDEGDNPIPSENIDFYARTHGEWKKFDSASTNASGVASVTYTPAIWGEHRVMANYNGSAAHIKNNSTATIIVNPLVVTLIIDSPDPLKVTLGKTITIKATLKDENEVPISNATIIFYFFKDGTWETIGSSETDSDGVAVLEYTPHVAGTFYIKAEFPGTQIYGKTSDEIKLNVRFDYTSYILVGVAAIAAIALIAFAIWRKRKKTSKI